MCKLYIHHPSAYALPNYPLLGIIAGRWTSATRYDLTRWSRLVSVLLQSLSLSFFSFIACTSHTASLAMSETFIGGFQWLLHSQLLLTSDHKPFLSEHFDVNAYANAVLSGRRYDPDAEHSEAAQLADGSAAKNVSTKSAKTKEGEKGDVGLELARLNYGIVSLPGPVLS